LESKNPIPPLRIPAKISIYDFNSWYILYNLLSKLTNLCIGSQHTKTNRC
jgi:hypothetical protein